MWRISQVCESYVGLLHTTNRKQKLSSAHAGSRVADQKIKFTRAGEFDCSCAGHLEALRLADTDFTNVGRSVLHKVTRWQLRKGG
jgi:hypothetical protein